MQKKMKKAVIGLLLGCMLAGSFGSMNTQAATKASTSPTKAVSFQRTASNSAKLVIKKVKTAKRYQVQYAYSKAKISSGKKVRVSQSKKGSVAVTLKNSKFKTEKNVYVRVRYVNKNNKYSKWSKVVKLNNSGFKYKKTKIKYYVKKTFYGLPVNNVQVFTIVNGEAKAANIDGYCCKTFIPDSEKYVNIDGTLKTGKVKELCTELTKKRSKLSDNDDISIIKAEALNYQYECSQYSHDTGKFETCYGSTWKDITIKFEQYKTGYAWVKK